jgi:serine/threonine protein kinase
LKYKIIRPIGKGATSKVFIGSNQQNQTVVIKQVRNKEEAAAEARILKDLPDHRFIISLLDSFDEYLVFEYYEGTRLGNFKKGIKRDTCSAVKITLNILEAVKIIHENGILHCDITPHNVLMKDDNPDTIKMIDFGSAVRKNAANEYIDTHIGATKWYRAPELKREKEGFTAHLNDSSDLYSTACVCLYLLNGEAPFRKRHACKQVKNVNLQQILRKAVYRDQRKRFQSAEEFIKALLPFAK